MKYVSLLYPLERERERNGIYYEEKGRILTSLEVSKQCSLFLGHGVDNHGLTQTIYRAFIRINYLTCITGLPWDFLCNLDMFLLPVIFLCKSRMVKVGTCQSCTLRRLIGTLTVTDININVRLQV